MPSVGKSTVAPLLRQLLSEGSKLPWISLDNEVNGFSSRMRVLCSERSGIKLDTPEFARSFNLRAQLDYQISARALAEQGFNVLLQGPFENLFAEVGGKKLWDKMREDDFAGYDLAVAYLLPWSVAAVSGDINLALCDPGFAWDEVTGLIRLRLDGRAGKDEVQPILDAPKLADPDYARGRLSLCVRSIMECGGDTHSQIVRGGFDCGEGILAQQMSALMTPQRVARQLNLLIRSLSHN